MGNWYWRKRGLLDRQPSGLLQGTIESCKHGPIWVFREALDNVTFKKEPFMVFNLYHWTNLYYY